MDYKQQQQYGGGQQYGEGQSQGYYNTPPQPPSAHYGQQQQQYNPPPQQQQQGKFRGEVLIDRFEFNVLTFFFIIKITISLNNLCTRNNHLHNNKVVVAKEDVWHGKS